MYIIPWKCNGIATNLYGKNIQVLLDNYIKARLIKTLNDQSNIKIPLSL